MKRVEIYILTGFLGSGKTTLLQKLLAEEKRNNRRVAVLMNELGEFSVDSGALPEDTLLKELLNGCVCCTIQAQLEEQLLNINNEYDLDVIYLEATGAAHPIEALESCMSPMVVKYMNVQAIISVVDAKRWHNKQKISIRLRKLMDEQTRHADVILINKADCVNEEELTQVRSEIKELNPQAKKIIAKFAQFDLTELKQEAVVQRGHHQPAHVYDHLHVHAFVYEFSKPVNQSLFEKWLETVPGNLYRAKGFIGLSGKKGLFMMQYSFGIPMFMPVTREFPMNMVFIGEGLDHKWIVNELNALEAKSNIAALRKE
jgi:G3E family GTPase